MNIGKKIKEERQKKGWTQEHLGSLLNVSRSTVSSWEVGRNVPDIETILLISDLYGVSLDKLLREDKEMLKDTIGMKVKVKKTGDYFQAVDEAENIRYSMKQTTAAIPTQRKYVIEDSRNQQVGTVKRKRYSLGGFDLPRLFLKVNSWQEISIIKDMIQLKSIYKIKGEGLTLEGSFLGDEFAIFRNGEKIADVSVTKEIDFSFDINILDEQLERLVISFVFLAALAYGEERNVIDLKQL